MGPHMEMATWKCYEILELRVGGGHSQLRNVIVPARESPRTPVGPRWRMLPGEPRKPPGDPREGPRRLPEALRKPPWP